MGRGIFDEAVDFLHDKATEFVDGAKNTYSDMVDQAGKALKYVAPVGAAGAIDEITHGVSSLGRDAIDFFDPVSYAMDLAGDALHSIDPVTLLDKGTNLYLTANGVDRSEQLKAAYADEALTAAQVAALLVPAGKVVKPLTKPLKQAVKTAKKAVKQTERATPERVLAKEQLRRSKRKKTVVTGVAKNSVRIGKQVARDDLAKKRHEIGYTPMFKRKSSISPRDWSKFGHDAESRFMQEQPLRIPRRND